jgi:hypothetical protein
MNFMNNGYIYKKKKNRIKMINAILNKLWVYLFFNLPILMNLKVYLSTLVNLSCYSITNSLSSCII